MLILVPPLVLGSLAVWFGLVESPGIGEGRCYGCGVEGYVVATHLVAAAAIGLVIARAAPGRPTLAALAGAAGLAAIAAVASGVAGVIGLVALLASLAVAPALAAWWLWAGLRRAGRRPIPRAHALAAAWLSLVVLVPAAFAWTWLDRVEWLVF